jgi:hypothetical protein
VRTTLLEAFPSRCVGGPRTASRGSCLPAEGQSPGRRPGHLVVVLSGRPFLVDRDTRSRDAQECVVSRPSVLRFVDIRTVIDPCWLRLDRERTEHLDQVAGPLSTRLWTGGERR